MESIVDTQLTGKWYHIAGTSRLVKMHFMEVFLYLSLDDKSFLEALCVGMRKNRSKIMKNLSLKIVEDDGSIIFVSRTIFLRMQFRLLLFDVKNGILIFTDNRKKHLSIFSRQSSLNRELVEKSLNVIEFFKLNGVKYKLYSNSIIG